MTKTCQNKRIIPILLIALTLIMGLWPANFAYGAPGGSVTVRYLDTQGNEIASSDTYNGEQGESLLITPPTVPGYTDPQETGGGQSTYTVVFEPSPQTIVFRYQTLNASLTAFYSLYLETTNTYTPYSSSHGDYFGNVVYYPHAGDSLAASWVTLIYTMTPGQASTYLYAPVDGKQPLSSLPILDIYDDAGTHFSEQSLTEHGYSFTLLYSTDNGVTFSESFSGQPEDIDALGLRLIKASDAISIESNENPLWVVAEFKTAPDSGDVINVQTPLSGWRLKLPPGSTVSLPIGVYPSSPSISGTVRTQDIPEGADPDWDNATALAGQRVGLVDDGDAVISTTLTDGNGAFMFGNVPTLSGLQIRIVTAEGLVYLYDGTTYAQQDTLAVGTLVDIDRTFRTFTDTTWKSGIVDPNASNAQGSRFLIPMQHEQPDPDEPLPIETDENRSDQALANTGDFSLQTAGVLGALCAIALCALVLGTLRYRVR